MNAARKPAQVTTPVSNYTDVHITLRIHKDVAELFRGAEEPRRILREWYRDHHLSAFDTGAPYSRDGLLIVETQHPSDTFIPAIPARNR